mmetsp:Transcript_81999/g.265663  ORF Transcript_81999/g.265663 Transcript_81999/m.265663 type:complete len:242 (-) Transcript_81999:982-1707(-)
MATRGAASISSPSGPAGGVWIQIRASCATQAGCSSPHFCRPPSFSFLWCFAHGTNNLYEQSGVTSNSPSSRSPGSAAAAPASRIPFSFFRFSRRAGALPPAPPRLPAAAASGFSSRPEFLRGGTKERRPCGQTYSKATYANLGADGPSRLRGSKEGSRQRPKCERLPSVKPESLAPSMGSTLMGPSATSPTKPLASGSADGRGLGVSPGLTRASLGLIGTSTGSDTKSQSSGKKGRKPTTF